MLRRVMLACALSLGLAASSAADSMGPETGGLPQGFLYSPSSSPFEAFEWTPLDLQAFAAYGGDFSNVRRPTPQFTIFENPFLPPAPRGPEDEQGAMQHLSMPFFEELPQLPAQEQRLTYQELPGLQDDPDGADSIPEPGVLALIGLGLLGVSSRLRRAYRASDR